MHDLLINFVSRLVHIKNEDEEFIIKLFEPLEIKKDLILVDFGGI